MELIAHSCSRSDSESLAGPSCVTECPISCGNSYGDCCIFYLFGFPERHAFILAEKKWPNCDSVCRDPAKRLHMFLLPGAELYPPMP